MPFWVRLRRKLRCYPTIFFADQHDTRWECPAIRLSRTGLLSWVGLVAVLVLLVGIAKANAQSAMPDRGNDEIARVNGVVITRREFQIVYRQAVDRHAQEGQPVDETHLAPLRRQVVQRMVEEELLIQESRRLGIVISNEEIDDDLAAARARFESPADFRRALDRQHWDEIQYRRQLKRQRAIDRLLTQEVDASVSVSEDEIRQYFEANPQRFHTPEMIRLRRILIRKAAGDESGANDTAYRQIMMIKGKLDQGEDFSALAEQYSQEPAREQGGDLGFVQRGQMLPSIDAAVFNLELGAISPVLTNQYGYQLVQVTERRAAVAIPYGEARADIRKTLFQAKQQTAVRAYIDELRQRADIQASQ